MRKLIAGAAVIAALAVASSANAADIARPVYKAPVMAPVYDWTGFYIGVNAGYTWSANDDVSYAVTDTGAAGFSAVAAAGALPPARLSNKGFIGGGQIGYNWQAGVWVWGLEADFQWVNGGESLASTYPGPAIVPFSTALSHDLDWFGTVRGRLGFTVTPNLLAYATGGFAYGKTKLSASYVAPAAAPPLAFFGQDSGTSTGWTVGAGFEWAMGNGWSLKGEYLYYDLGSSSVTAVYTDSVDTSTLKTSIDHAGHIVRAGLNYKFGYGQSPVVAKY